MVPDTPAVVVMRIAFPLIDRQRWAGGYNYLRNLLRVLAAEAPGEIIGVVFVGSDAAPQDVAELAAVAGVEVVHDARFDGRNRRAGLRRALLTGRDTAALGAFDDARIDLIFEVAQFYGWRSPIPVLAWLPDFQHRHLGRLFGRQAWARRELGFRAQVAAGRHLLLSSDDARADVENFYPSSRGRTSVVRFAVPWSAGEGDAADAAVAAELGLPERFFFLPNQLWLHKNHALVIDALALLAARGLTAVVAVTGGANDPRDPGHGARLTARAQAMAVATGFRQLGSIPYAQVGALLRRCTALINPSRFEGWSTAVEEAKSAGTPMLLSDLGVHREQAGQRARYFGVDDVAALSALMAYCLDVAPPRADPASTAAEANIRVRDFAEQFLAAATRAVGHHSRR